MTGLSGKRILIVEEEPLIAMDEEVILARTSCNVVGPVSTFKKARQLIAIDRIDAALVDGTIGGVPAYAFVGELKQKNIPFIILTAPGLYRPQGLPVRDFADAVFVDKPYFPQQLIEALEALLNPDQPDSS